MLGNTYILTVQCLLQGGLLDIFAISESKLDESFPLAQLKVNDF